MRILIADDEKPARDRLRQILDDFEEHTVVGEAANGEQVLSLSDTEQPDVVLLDIRMPGLDGIETAHHLNALDEPPAVVFTTAYDEYAIEAFEARAIGYILKPVRRGRLAAALQQAARLTAGTLTEIARQPGIETSRRHVCTRSHGELKLIPVETIHFFRADQKYVCVYHDEGENLIDDSLKSLEKEFADTFVRIHRSIVVAVGRIDRIEKTGDGKHRVVLRGNVHDIDQDLVISRRHVADVKHRLKGS